MFRKGTVLPVVGVSFHQPAHADVQVGDVVRLTHEADNPYDAQAVAVLKANGEILGHLPATLAGRMTNPSQGGGSRRHRHSHGGGVDIVHHAQR